MFKPSIYQENIFNWIREGSGNGIVNAVAGAGKTKTLVEASKIIKDFKSIFIAFNKHIVAELNEQLPKGFDCKTIHAIGFNALYRYFDDKPNVEEYKYGNLSKNAAQKLKMNIDADYQIQRQLWLSNSIEKINEVSEPKPPPSFEEIKGEIIRLLDLSRNTLTNLSDITDVRNLAEHYGIEEYIGFEQILPIVNEILEEGVNLAKNNREIDYTDMIYLPNLWNLNLYKKDWILVDEAQDLNAAQLNLVLKLSKPTSRFLFVGDPRQAIYGFAGADTNSFSNIQRHTKAKELELSICYRCPKKVIELAQSIVSVIQAAPNAKSGEVVSISEEQLIKNVLEGDLVVCRSTEPLVRNCISLISNKIAATVKGRDIGKSLIAIINEVKKISGFSFDKFGYYLNLYSKERIEKLIKKQNSERKILEFKDQILSIETCYQKFHTYSIENLCHEIEKLFSDTRSSVTLSTIHRAKGLEEDRVFILNYERLPLTWPDQKEWQLEQEQNLKYVAITRAKQSLYLVNETPLIIDFKNTFKTFFKSPFSIDKDDIGF